jgi:hypothetical protein
MLPSISSSISLVSDVTATTTASGPAAPLGSTYTIPASDVDRGLVVVKSDGSVEGDARATVPSGGELVTLAAGEGELELIYVKNVSTALIERGMPVALDYANGAYAIKKAVAPALIESSASVIGIALFDIPNNKAAWVVKRGVVKGLFDAAVTVGQALQPNSDSELAVLVTPSGTTSFTQAMSYSTRIVALEAGGTGTLAKVKING